MHSSTANHNYVSTFKTQTVRLGTAYVFPDKVSEHIQIKYQRVVEIPEDHSLIAA
jgi:hypothetical protein